MSITKLGYGTLAYLREYENKNEERTVNFFKNVKFSEQCKKLFGIDSDYTVDDFLNFNYQTNNYGFRDIDFSLDNNENEIWCFGCSWTYGVGVIDRLSWPKIIQNNTGIITKNFGVGGSGPETCLRLLNYWLSNSKHKPIAIYINGFFPGRTEFEIPGHPVISLINSHTVISNIKLIKKSNLIDKNQKNILIKNIETKYENTGRLYERCYNSIHDIISKHKIEYKIQSIESFKKYDAIYGGSAGRDIPNVSGFIKALEKRDFDFKHPDIVNLAAPHPGVTAHKIMSEFFTR